MTRDDIIKALDWHAPTVETGPQSLLRRIETLVAQAEAAEREACSNACDRLYYQYIGKEFGSVRYGIAACSHAIRARGNHGQA